VLDKLDLDVTGSVFPNCFQPESMRCQGELGRFLGSPKHRPPVRQPLTLSRVGFGSPLPGVIWGSTGYPKRDLAIEPKPWLVPLTALGARPQFEYCTALRVSPEIAASRPT